MFGPIADAWLDLPNRIPGVVSSLLNWSNDIVTIGGDAVGVPGSVAGGLGAAAAASNQSSFNAAFAAALASLAGGAVAAPIMPVDPNSAILIGGGVEAWTFDVLYSIFSIPPDQIQPRDEWGNPVPYWGYGLGWETHHLDALRDAINRQRGCE